MMDTEEAREHLQSFVSELRGLTYEELREQCKGGMTRDFVTRNGN